MKLKWCDVGAINAHTLKVGRWDLEIRFALHAWLTFERSVSLLRQRQSVPLHLSVTIRKFRRYTDSL